MWLCGHSLSYVFSSFYPRGENYAQKNNCVYDKLLSFIASSPSMGSSLSQHLFVSGVSHVNHPGKQQLVHLSRVLWLCPSILLYSLVLVLDLLPALSQSIPVSLALHLSLVLGTSARMGAMAALRGLPCGFWSR